METVGIVCEYNPLHLGHQKQFSIIRRELGEDTAIVCMMSGNYVQRGHPAIFHKSLRARAAVLSGADLVLEMPVTTALSSAEGFASGAVGLLGAFCHRLCFGAEDADEQALQRLAKGLLSPDFTIVLREHLDAGLSFPAARQKALAQMGLPGELLEKPNNILAVEYCKAIAQQNLAMKAMPIFRGGNYHDTDADAENPSATAIRELICKGEKWEHFLPVNCYDGAAVHTLQAGEKAVLAKLRTMTEDEFAAVPYGSEGLWRKLMHAVHQNAGLAEIAESVKSKRYTRSRIDRMIMCAFLGITQADMATSAPYARVLAMSERGRNVLKSARKTGFYPNIGEKTGLEYEILEQRCEALYGLFATDGIEPPNGKSRIYLK